MLLIVMHDVLILIVSENEDFPNEAKRLLEKLVDGNILQAEVVAVEHDGIPYVELTCVQDCQV